MRLSLGNVLQDRAVSLAEVKSEGRWEKPQNCAVRSNQVFTMRFLKPRIGFCGMIENIPPGRIHYV